MITTAVLIVIQVTSKMITRVKITVMEAVQETGTKIPAAAAGTAVATVAATGAVLQEIIIQEATNTAVASMATATVLQQATANAGVQTETHREEAVTATQDLITDHRDVADRSQAAT